MLNEIVLLLFVAWSSSACGPAVSCVTSDTPESCQDRGLYYKESVRFNGCCPGCIELPGFNETCTEDGGCAPGYFCSPDDDDVCVEDKTQVCEQAQRNAGPGEWIPECQIDGMYAPKQCKGEPLSGICFCYSPEGDRIFGEALWQAAGNMTCACSRHMWEELKIRKDVTWHCDDLGNYEELQCDNGRCWCAHPVTGLPYSKQVSDKMMKALPCYVTAIHGDQYLRQCDSLYISEENARSLMEIHGTNGINFPPVNCNYDGSYNRVQNINNKYKCVGKDGNYLSEWTTDLSEKGVTCNCDYDKSVATGAFNYQCEQNGNYAEKQYNGAAAFCVDQDGFNKPCKVPN